MRIVIQLTDPLLSVLDLYVAVFFGAAALLSLSACVYYSYQLIRYIMRR